MKQKYFSKILIIAFLLGVNTSWGQVYNADFSNNGDGFPDHTSSAPPATGPQTTTNFGAAPNSWNLSYVSTPATDSTTNSFKVSGGVLTCNDWGGQGIFQSISIDVSTYMSVNISASGVNSGANDDDFTYFYILDGGSRVETSIGVTNNGDPVNYNVTALDVSGASTLIIGFEFDENGSGDGYDIAEFKVDGEVLNTENTENKLNVRVYPNPVTDGRLFIKSNNSEIKNIEIYNVLGRKVLVDRVNSNQEINVSNLSAGVYVLRINEGDKSLTKKIVIK